MFVWQIINGKDSYSKRKTEWYLTFQIHVFLNPAFWSTQCLCDQLDNCPEASGGAQMHTSISAIQLIRVFIIHGVPVGQLAGSWLGLLNFLHMVVAEWGKQTGCGEYCRWGAVVPEHFPWLKRKPWIWGSPTCECPGKSPDTPQEKYLLVRGHFRSVRLDQEKATRAPCKSVMSELSHLLTIFPVPTWPKEWRSREGDNRMLQKWTHLHFLVGSLGLSRGEGNVE